MSMRHFFLWMLTILLLVVGFGEFANAGTGAIPKGPDVLILKPNLLFKGGDVKIMTGDATDPTGTSRDADIGSAYIKQDDGVWYKKTDAGDTVNWQNFIFGALGLAGVDTCIPRWDVGTGVLQDSSMCIRDTGEMETVGVDGALVTSTSDGGDTLAWSINGGGGAVDPTRGSFIQVTGNEDGLQGSILIGMGDNPAGQGLLLLDSTSTTILQAEKDGDIRIGKVGQFLDLTTDTHADTLHIGPTVTSASSTSKLEVEDDTNTVVMTVEDDGDILLGKSGQEVTVQSIDIVDVAERTVLVQDGALGLVATGVSVSATDDVSGVNNFSLTGNVEYTGNFSIASDATDGTDNTSIQISGGGGIGFTRGANLILAGNESGSTGDAQILLGQAPLAEFQVRGFSGGTIFSIGGLNETINYPSPTPNLPLALDASNDIISRAIDISTGDITGVLPIANGGTNSSTALNNDRIMVSSGGSIVEAPALADGELLIGSSGSAPVASTLTGTLNQIDVTNASGSITLSLPQDIATTSSPTFSTILATDLTAGSVVFAGASSELADDNGNLFYDNASDALGLGTNTIDTNAILHVSSSSKGILIPNLTTAQKTAMVGPTESMLLYDLDIQKFNYWNGTAWKNLSGSAFSSEDVAIDDYDEVRFPLNQLTVVSSSATNKIARIETGNDNFLANPSFEAETYTSGWTTSGSATYTLNPDAWEGQGVSISATGGTQSFELFQSFTDTEFEGNTFGFTCMVKSNSAKVKLCTENGTDEKDCVYHDGNGMWKKMQAIMMVDSTGVLVGSVKNDVNENAEVVVDDCRWTNDPLKIKNALSTNSIDLEGNGGEAVTAGATDITFNGSGTGWDGTGYTVQKPNAKVRFSGSVRTTGAAARNIEIYLNNSLYRVVGHREVDANFIHKFEYKSAKGEFQAGDRIAFRINANSTNLSNDAVNHYLTINEELENEEILTASDIVSSETMAFTFKGSGAGALDCNTDPVGTYTTYSKAVNTNSTVQCASAPNTVPNNLDGILVYPAFWGDATGCTNAISKFDICIGKGLKGLSVRAYEGAAKSIANLSLEKLNDGTVDIGADYFYNENTGEFTFFASKSTNSTIVQRNMNKEDGSSTLVNTQYYVHFHASKNPVVNAIETIPIVDYSWENEFSAKIDNNGTASIADQNQTFVATVANGGLGIVNGTFETGFFSQIPSCVCTTEDASTTGCSIDTLTTTGFTVRTRIFSTSGGNNVDFNLQCSRSGSDYKERGSTAAIIAQPTCYVKDYQPQGTQGGSAVVQNIQTRVLNTLEGDCSYVSLSSNQMTLQEGTYKIDCQAPAYNADENQVFFWNDTTSEYVLIGQNGFSNASAQTRQRVYGTIVVTGVHNFELIHWTNANNGGSQSLGIESANNVNNPATQNLYSSCLITRIK